MVTVQREEPAVVLNDPDFRKVSAAYAKEGIKELVGDDWAVDFERYTALGSSGMYHVFTLRSDGRLIGFGTITEMPSLHTSKPIALVESLFVLSEYRSYSTSLIAAMCSFTRYRGISHMSLSAPVGSKLDRFLSVQERRGKAKHVYNMYLMEA